jgi:AraC-like DNA-binding protein
MTQRYLVERSLKLTDIAAQVGYSALSAFSGAARRWFGTSPRLGSAAGRLTSTPRPEQRFGIGKNLRVIEGELVRAPVPDPLGTRSVRA